MPENIELPGASHNKTNQVERAVDTPADFTSPEELYKDLITAIKKYHPSTDLSDIEKAYETAKMCIRDRHNCQANRQLCQLI